LQLMFPFSSSVLLPTVANFQPLEYEKTLGKLRCWAEVENGCNSEVAFRFSGFVHGYFRCTCSSVGNVVNLKGAPLLYFTFVFIRPCW
jgi:hypothetical protein